MAMTTINGFPIYAVTRNDVEYRPSYFQQQAETWVEGSKRDSLTRQEIEELKRRYNCKNMSEEDTVSLFGELVEAGIMSTSTARDIFCGATPLDVSKIDPTKPQSVLTKCDEAYESRMSGIRSFEGLRAMFSVGGLDAYKNWYEYAKSVTDVDVEEHRYFQEYRKFLEVLGQIGV